ncbi:hypothetical protein NP233_g727 [Leucocoprinus birnbaumii]|uniref:Ran guanine nucleotide release factor n=1 Tax=Leucocoprinus birnbaumii TaxID=56174 RepID=A0AAD5W1T7_9AGAR|nr:hypothetical protein NP233_g727 [Leucocoprinus birnbaumii]
MTTSYINRDLFGGAITAMTPAELVDASDLRQVPDNQEVFMYDRNSVSIIVEVLQAVNASEADKAIRFHFDSLAHDNSAEKSEVQQVDIIPNARGDTTPPAIILQGTQFVHKFNRQEVDTVKILMALYRVQDKNVDLVVTFNVPLVAEAGAVSEADMLQVTHDFHEFRPVTKDCQLWTLRIIKLRPICVRCNGFPVDTRFAGVCRTVSSICSWCGCTIVNEAK